MKYINKIYIKSSEIMRDLPDESVDLMVTSPPYNIDIKFGNKWKNRKIVKSKGIKYDDSLPWDEYKLLLENVINETYRVLKPNGTVFFNIKNRIENDAMIPPFFIMDYFKEMYLKNIIIWNFDWGGSTGKRFSSRYEYIFFFSKSKKEWVFNLDDISIPSVNFRPDRYKTQFKNPSDVWSIPMVSGSFTERTNHPAQYPEKLIERIIKAVTNPGDLVLDPFLGSGTTAVVAKKLKRNYVGYEINKDYVKMAKNRLKNEN
jgi:DNA modification methylase